MRKEAFHTGGDDDSDDDHDDADGGDNDDVNNGDGDDDEDRATEDAYKPASQFSGGIGSHFVWLTF